jgi:hypothetical protein
MASVIGLVVPEVFWTKKKTFCGIGGYHSGLEGRLTSISSPGKKLREWWGQGWICGQDNHYFIHDAYRLYWLILADVVDWNGMDDKSIVIHFGFLFPVCTWALLNIYISCACVRTLELCCLYCSPHDYVHHSSRNAAEATHQAWNDSSYATSNNMIQTKVNHSWNQSKFHRFFCC